jgi:hypothetical protein
MSNSNFLAEPLDSTKKVLRAVDSLSSSLRTNAATNPTTVLNHV